MGALPPGVIWFWPAWKRISHIITRATITYNAPAQNCPTADNGTYSRDYILTCHYGCDSFQTTKHFLIFILMFLLLRTIVIGDLIMYMLFIGVVMVNVDLSLTFRIGPDVDAAQAFVYRLGAHRFDELLSAEAEEAIRGLVYSVTHDKVNDLREEFALGMLTTLNSKTNIYGVQILNVKITDVKLPIDLQKRLERTTAFKTKMGEQEKSHENRVRVLEDEATKELETIRKSNARKIQEIVAERNRYDIERREMEERARGEARVQEVHAVTETEVALKKVQGDEVVMKVKAKQDAEALLKRAQVESQKLKIEAEQKATVMIKQSEAELKVAESNAAAMIAKAEAEAEGAQALSEKRRYELEWARLSVLKQIAGTGRRFITGQAGQSILNDLVPTSTKGGK
eukprot:scaffold86142_cov51-Attheya_sp.AAC.2